MITPVRHTVWSIDRGDTITGVGGDWDDFATVNDAPHLAGTRVVGMPLFDFIAGEPTQRIYRLLLRRARATRETIRVPFRCDSPDMRRHMRLEIVPADEDGIELRGVFLGGYSRDRFRLLDVNEPRSHAEIAACSFCMRLLAPTKDWLEPEDVIARFDLLDGPETPQIVHSVCPDCEARIRDSG